MMDFSPEHARLIEEVRASIPAPAPDSSELKKSEWEFIQKSTERMSIAHLERSLKANLIRHSGAPVEHWSDMIVCGRCRGYRPERQHCDCCDGKGVLRVMRMDLVAGIPGDPNAARYGWSTQRRLMENRV